MWLFQWFVNSKKRFIKLHLNTFSYFRKTLSYCWQHRHWDAVDSECCWFYELQCVYPPCVAIQEVVYSSCLSVVRDQDLVRAIDRLCPRAWNFVCVGHKPGNSHKAPPPHCNCTGLACNCSPMPRALIVSLFQSEHNSECVNIDESKLDFT